MLLCAGNPSHHVSQPLCTSMETHSCGLFWGISCYHGNPQPSFLGVITHILGVQNLHFSWFWGLSAINTRFQRLQSNLTGTCTKVFLSSSSDRASLHTTLESVFLIMHVHTWNTVLGRWMQKTTTCDIWSISITCHYDHSHCLQRNSYSRVLTFSVIISEAPSSHMPKRHWTNVMKLHHVHDVIK